MIEKNFGNTIDIHGGGLDLIFPHHENEIAQSKCSHGGANLANYWMHNGYLTVDGEKMSKSLGNFVTVHELLKEFNGGGEDIRLCLLTAHYRQPVDFSKDGVLQAKKQLDRWYRITKGFSGLEPSEKVINALKDDLNTPEAIMELNQLAKKAVDDDHSKSVLIASAQLLGLLHSSYEERFHGKLRDDDQLAKDISSIPNLEIELLIDERMDAKKNKDFARADEIRNELSEQGITLLDGPDGTTWEKK